MRYIDVFAHRIPSAASTADATTTSRRADGGIERGIHLRADRLKSASGASSPGHRQSRNHVESTFNGERR